MIAALRETQTFDIDVRRLPAGDSANVDFSILIEAGSEVRVAEALLARLEPRIADAADFAK